MSDRTGAVEKLLAMVTRTDGAAAPELDAQGPPQPRGRARRGLEAEALSALVVGNAAPLEDVPLISRSAHGGVRRIHVEIRRERGRDDAHRAALDDRSAPQRAGLGVAERNRAFEIFALVVGVSSGANVHEPGDHAFGRCGKGIDAERQPVLVP